MEQVVNENTKVELTEQKPKKKIWKGILFSILSLIAAFCIQALVSFPMTTILMAQCTAEVGGDVEAATALYMERALGTDFTTNLLLTLTLGYGLVMLLWYKLAFVKKYTAENKKIFKENVLNGKVIVSLVIAAVGCYCLDVLVANIVALISPSALETFNATMASTTSGNEVVSFLTIVIAAPIAEELLFRGIIFSMLRKHWSDVAAIIVSALLFGLYHMNLMQAIYVLPIGLLLGYTAYKCKSVLPCILIHMVNNFMPTLVGMLPEACQSMVVIVIGFVICAAVLFFLWKKPNKIVE